MIWKYVSFLMLVDKYSTMTVLGSIAGIIIGARYGGSILMNSIKEKK